MQLLKLFFSSFYINLIISILSFALMFLTGLIIYKVYEKSNEVNAFLVANAIQDSSTLK